MLSGLALGYLKFISWQERNSYSCNDQSYILMFPLSKDNKSTLHILSSLLRQIMLHVIVFRIQVGNDPFTSTQYPCSKPGMCGELLEDIILVPHQEYP